MTTRGRAPDSTARRHSLTRGQINRDWTEIRVVPSEKMGYNVTVMQAFVNCCPKCGSRDAHCDDARSKGDMSCMVCRACGHTDTVDSYRRDAEWLVEEKASESQRGPLKKR